MLSRAEKEPQGSRVRPKLLAFAPILLVPVSGEGGVTKREEVIHFSACPQSLPLSSGNATELFATHEDSVKPANTQSFVLKEKGGGGDMHI